MADQLRLGVLTTDTAHHRYFLRTLHRELPSDARLVVSLFEEWPYPWGRRARRHIFRYWFNPWRALVLNPYMQWNSQTRRQAEFEAAHFFPDGDRSVPSQVDTHCVFSGNDDDAARILDEASLDLLLVYGTGRVEPKVYGRPRLGSINAHGGLLPGYRGLDTNLWAVLEGRPEDMAVTIHEVEREFDTGAVVAQARIGPVPGLRLENLRYHTTVLCVDLFLEAVCGYLAGRITPMPQDGTSRYFGPMPGYLKRKCDGLLRRYAEGTSAASQPETV